VANPNLESYTITVTATDGTSSSSQSFAWSVTSAISITPIPDQHAISFYFFSALSFQQNVSLQVIATDQNNLQLTFSADNLPPGLSIDPQSGLISGSSSWGWSGVTTVTVTDGTSSSIQTFAWNTNFFLPQPILLGPPGVVVWNWATISPPQFSFSESSLGRGLPMDEPGLVPMNNTVLNNPGTFEPAPGGSFVAGAGDAAASKETEDLLPSIADADQLIAATVAPLVNGGRFQSSSPTGGNPNGMFPSQAGPLDAGYVLSGQSEVTGEKTAPLTWNDAMRTADNQQPIDPAADWIALNDAKDAKLSG
jgi:hypothetical protein